MHDPHAVTTVDQLEAIMGHPRQTIADKVTPYLTPLLRDFIESAPFFLMATANADGTCDVTPRGDPPGQSLRIVDDRTLALPERPGNRRLDSLRNMLTNGQVGLLFLVPGTDEMVRVNGRARISADPEMCESLAINGKSPQLVVVVEIEEAFTHCARSILRSKVWEPSSWPDPDTIPTLAAMMAEQAGDVLPDEREGKRNEEYRTRLY